MGVYLILGLNCARHFVCFLLSLFAFESSLGISNFLEEISSLSHSIVFLYFFALITGEGFLFLLALLWNSAFRCIYLSFSHLPLASLLFLGIFNTSFDSHFAFLHFFFLGMVLINAAIKTILKKKKIPFYIVANILFVTMNSSCQVLSHSALLSGDNSSYWFPVVASQIFCMFTCRYLLLLAFSSSIFMLAHIFLFCNWTRKTFISALLTMPMSLTVWITVIWVVKIFFVYLFCVFLPSLLNIFCFC